MRIVVLLALAVLPCLTAGTRCERARKEAQESGEREPQCNESGQFKRKQCDNDGCWCVSPRKGRPAYKGQKVPLDHPYDCSKKPKACLKKTLEILVANPNNPDCLPECDDVGKYVHKQREECPAPTSPTCDSLNMVGWWPLQEAFGGDDLCGHANHIELHDVSFPDDDVTPWARPAAAFNATVASYGIIQNGQHLDVKSFSWMTKIYPQSKYDVSCLLEWTYNGQVGVQIWLEVGYLETIITIPGCSSHLAYHPASFSINAWHTMAVTYDFPTNTLTLWQDGESHVSTEPACGSTIATSSELYIGYRPRSYLPFNGRLSCMSLYISVVDYDVMYAATMSHCGGDDLH